MRFGLTSAPDELDARETGLILGALSAQKRYCLRLAAKNSDTEAMGRNMVNALELEVLMDKLKGEKK